MKWLSLIWRRLGSLAALLLAPSLSGCGSSLRLPSMLGTAEQIEALADSGIMMEGCSFEADRLDQETIARVRADGISFLASVGTPPGSSQAYGPWRVTPGGKDTERAVGAVTCLRAETSSRLEKAIQSPGSFYALSQNSEGIMVVDPAAGLAWVMYYG